MKVNPYHHSTTEQAQTNQFFRRPGRAAQPDPLRLNEARNCAMVARRSVPIGGKEIVTEEEKLALLQKSCRRWTLICSLTLLFGALAVGRHGPESGFQRARRWLMIAALVVAGEFWFLRRTLDRNHPPDSERPLRGPGRGQPADDLARPRLRMDGRFSPDAPARRTDRLAAGSALWWGQASSTFSTGYVARRTNRVSRLGETLDMEYDGLGVLTACALAVQYGQLPLLFLLVGAGPSAFRLGDVVAHAHGATQLSDDGE